MGLRYLKYNFILQSFLISKTSNYDNVNLVNVSSIKFSLGHFKLTSMYPEHGLIFIGLSGQKPTVSFFSHGKRLQKTVLLSSSFNSELAIYEFVDRFVNVILPNIHDLRIVKLKRQNNNCYTWHLKKYFEWEEVDNFISDRLILKPFLVPITLELKTNGYFLDSQNYLRMLRFPFIFYKNTAPEIGEVF